MSASDITDYSSEVEELFIRYMISKPDLYVRCKGILRAEYFDDKQNQKTVEFINSYSDDFSSMPDLSQIQAIIKTEDKLIDRDINGARGIYLKHVSFALNY